MKQKLYFLLIFISLGIFACNSGNNTDTNAVAKKNSSTSVANDHAGHDHSGHDHAGHSHGNETKSKHVPASPLSPYLGMWQYSYTMKIRDKEAQKKNEGRWIKFESDKSFTSGRWEEQTNKGTWEIDPDTNKLKLDYENHLDQVDRTWKVQGSGDIFIWNGTKENNSTGTSIKMERIESRPVKK